MSNPKYACVIPGCTETRVCNNIISHILSHEESEIKAKLGETLASGAQGSLLRLVIKMGETTRKFRACLGCKKLFRKVTLEISHIQDCPNKEKHKEVCKSLLVSKPVAPSEPVTPSEDLSKYIKEIESLKRNLKTAQSSNDRLSDIEETLFECLTAYKKGTAFNFFMIDFQDSQPELAIDMMNRLEPKIESSDEPE